MPDKINLPPIISIDFSNLVEHQSVSIIFQFQFLSSQSEDSKSYSAWLYEMWNSCMNVIPKRLRMRPTRSYSKQQRKIVNKEIKTSKVLINTQKISQNLIARIAHSSKQVNCEQNPHLTYPQHPSRDHIQRLTYRQHPSRDSIQRLTYPQHPSRDPIQRLTYQQHPSRDSIQRLTYPQQPSRDSTHAIHRLPHEETR